MHRAGARPDDLGKITAHQHLAKVQHEIRDIRRHHGSGRRVRQRNLHQRILHRRAAEEEPPIAYPRTELLARIALSQQLALVPAAMDGTVSARRAQQILSKVYNCRGEIGIVRTALDDRLLLDERLIFSI